MSISGPQIPKLLSVDLNGCGAYHKYVERKATRDIHIHNSGIANEIYVPKSSSHKRVRSGEALAVDINHFMQSYEVCIQLTEWLEREPHKHWYSSEFDEREQRLKRPPPPVIDVADAVRAFESVSGEVFKVPPLPEPEESDVNK